MKLRLLTKSLRPLPSDYCMADQEVNAASGSGLITDEAARKRFRARSEALGSIRAFMIANGFMEVETPMLHPIPGGANAKPFVTHHNALDQAMYLRIAPELYLKRLIVGGFERVFEINRSFRNEGISVRHNPEFTMMEFYAAYWNHHDLMDFTKRCCATRREKRRLNRSPTRASRTRASSRADGTDSLSQRRAQRREAGDAECCARLVACKGPPAHTLAELQFGLFAAVSRQLWQPPSSSTTVEVSPLARASDTTGIPSASDCSSPAAVPNGSQLNDAEDRRALPLSANKEAGDGGDVPAPISSARSNKHASTGGCGIGIVG